MRLIVFADERKKILQRWDYIAKTIVPTNQALFLYNDLVEDRRNANYDYKLSYSSLNKSGKGSLKLN